MNILHGSISWISQNLGFSGAAICVIIIGLFLWFSYRYLFNLWRTSTALERAAARLRRAPHAATPPLFAGASPHLARLWSRFLRERKGTTRRYQGEEISTLAPEEIFTEPEILRDYNRNLSVTLAGIYTGLGILGTFIGLVAGLAQIDAATPEAIVGSVRGLMGGMSTAFYTSIVGIVISLIWLFLDRILYHRVRKHAIAFLEAVRQGFPVESADRILHRLLQVEEQETEILTDQKGILQSLSTDLSVAFQEALTQGLSTHLVPAIQAMGEKLDALSIHFGDQQVEAMGHMVNHFREHLTSEMQGQFEHLAATLEHAAAWHERQQKDLEVLLDRIQRASEDQARIIEQGTTAADTFSRGLAALGGAHEQVETAAGRLGSTADRLGQSLDGIGDKLAEQNRALQESVDELDRQHDAYREANEKIRVQLAAQVDSIADQVATMSGFWAEFRDEFASVGQHLRESVAEFSVGTAQRLQEIFARFDSEMATVVEHLGGTLAEIREVTEDLPANVGRLRQTTAEAGASMRSVIEAMVGLRAAFQPIGGMTPVVEQLPASIGRVGELLDRADGTLAALSNRLVSLDERLGEVVRTPFPDGHRQIAAGHDPDEGIDFSNG